MPPILNLKFKGNKSFVAFSNLGDVESLTKTWKVCSKVASYLEQGQRLENLSWRLWHLQSLIVDTDNAKSKREFKKLSKCMGDKLDKEKGRSIEELEAPDFKHNHSADMIRQRAAEKERSREASQNAKPGTIKRMQFTFSIDSAPTTASVGNQHQHAHHQSVKKPDLKPSPEFRDSHKRAGNRPGTRSASKQRELFHQQQQQQQLLLSHNDVDMADDEAEEKDAAPHSLASTCTTQRGRKFGAVGDLSDISTSVHFPSYFPNGFDASAVLFGAPSMMPTRFKYGENVGLHADANDGFGVVRPTIELPFDDIFDTASAESLDSSSCSPNSSISTDNGYSDDGPVHSIHDRGIAIHSAAANATAAALTVTAVLSEAANASTPRPNDFDDSSDGDDDDDMLPPAMTHKTHQPMSVPVSQRAVKAGATPSQGNSKASSGGPASGLRGGGGRSSHHNSNSNSGHGRPALTVRTQPLTASTRSSGPGATATNVNPAVLRSGGNHGASKDGTAIANNSAPGGVKAECSNCGATHTPLWRRGLNDELNCNACGLYCKLHKRPRPKSMRNTHGEGRAQAAPRHETADVLAQCYNCHTMATPLWRKDDEGKTVCNACGLYYKLHGSARPISMKSDVIRKRSRHDARRAGAAAPETPSASPGASRRTSPTIEPSPTLAPDSTTQMTYEYNSESEYRVSPSELSGALGCQEPSQNHFSSPNSFPNIFGLNVFPGPYHPDILQQQLQYGTNGGGGAGNGNGMMVNDPLPFASMDSAEIESVATPSRSTKRRRMSTDSAEDPPSSAVSFSSYNDGYSSASSATSLSQRSSMEFPYSSYTSSFGILRGSGNTFWHPPMMPASQDRSPQFVHPPMLPPVTSNCGPGSAGGAEESPMDYLHPPMVLQDEESLFSAYLHPPMVLTEEPLSQQPQQTQQQQQQQQQQSKQQQQRSPPAVASALQPHPPMFPNDSIFHAAGSELYDSAMHAF